MTDAIAKQLKKDLLTTLDLYPGLSVIYSGKDPKKLKGKIEVKDNEDVTQGIFDVEIIVPKEYPKTIPVLKVLNGISKNDVEHHINDDGSACLGVPASLIIENPRGISIFIFIQKYVYGFLCAQLYYEGKHEWPGGDWPHGNDGIRSFYFSKLMTNNPEFVVECLDKVIRHKLPDRNDTCFCGSGKKAKYCHLPSLEEISILSASILQAEVRHFLIND